MGPSSLHLPNSYAEELGFSCNEASSGVCPEPLDGEVLRPGICTVGMWLLPLFALGLLLGSCCLLCCTPHIPRTGTGSWYFCLPAPGGEQTLTRHCTGTLCFIVLHRRCVFLQIKDLLQPCDQQVYWRHFSNSICSICVCITFW